MTTLRPAITRRNRLALLLEAILFTFASSLLDPRTILPAFVSNYSSSLVLIALLPAIRSGGWLLPQLFAAHLMRRHVRKKPWLLGAGVVCRFPIAATPILLFAAPHAPAAVILGVFYLTLVLFAVADSVAGVAWYDIVGKALPGADRPWLFGGMSVGGAVMGLIAGVAIRAVLDSPRWPFPRDYGLVFGLACVALALGFVVLMGLVEPAGDIQDPRDEHSSTLAELRRLLGDGGPFARLMWIQLLLGGPALASGLYTPFALHNLALPADVTGLFVAATAVGSAMAGLGLPVLARRRGSVLVLRATALPIVLAPWLVAVAGLFPTHLERETICALSFFCQGAAMTGLFMGIGDLVLTMAPADRRPLYIGLANTMGGLLVPLPIVGGLVAQWVGPSIVLWVCSLPALAGVALLHRLGRALPAT